ncbi:hypothetical protein B0T26DRAFT_636943 [Lasiosphaeria miniovina]|uniref:Uncharacterized protein n=1 Tax=Lasiosphaeria miniovina TaxID=1954250 RepID=A0AA40B6G2_9PEZI|nr:uncharacterized protein B0T26DRAFT_636943 [Lasiosphaeria miniovina]KAK0728595.1 hypothetical protein B0T26DRAFT_636943 [Lasiosphaeria miniovina]
MILSTGRQSRFKSSQSTLRGGTTQNASHVRGAPEQPRPRNPPSYRQIFRLFWDSLKNLVGLARSDALREAYRTNPEEVIAALVGLIAITAIFGYAIVLIFTYFYAEQFTRFPEPIAQALRRALYYSNYAPDPQRALKYYQKALDLCNEMNLDPFSDEVMGIRIQIAAWLEKLESYENAAKTLEALLADCRRWVQVMEKEVKEGTAPKTLLDPQNLDEVTETLWGKRTRILAKSVAISVKLADLYSDEHMREDELAHERLVWAVETGLGELRRRTAEGLKKGEGVWMSSEELGGALEALGHSYEAKSQFHLALPLFFRALQLCKEPCHIAVLMNNIATSFAQHPLLAIGDAPVDGLMEQPKEAATAAEQRASYLAAARRWASNANQHATEPQGDKRTAECDEACAVSLANLGDIASLTGDLTRARRMFEQAIAMSKKIGFEAGITQAEGGLRALSQSGPVAVAA